MCFQFSILHLPGSLLQWPKLSSQLLEQWLLRTLSIDTFQVRKDLLTFPITWSILNKRFRAHQDCRTSMLSDGNMADITCRIVFAWDMIGLSLEARLPIQTSKWGMFIGRMIFPQFQIYYLSNFRSLSRLLKVTMDTTDNIWSTARYGSWQNTVFIAQLF